MPQSSLTPDVALAATKLHFRRLPTYLHASDIQGLVQLATRGVLGVADLAQTVHGNVYRAVATPFGPLGEAFISRRPDDKGMRPGGISSWVYRSLKGTTRLAGGAVHTLLARTRPWVGTQTSSRQREAFLAVINGVLGDQLAAGANPLAISMSLRHHGQALPLEKAALAKRLPNAGGKLLVLLHGLCMNDWQWSSSGPFGEAVLAQQLTDHLGYTPVFLHYNSGLHTSENGLLFANLLEQLLKAWPQAVDEIALLGHSMGGLVARSACQQAEQAGLPWRGKLKNLICLGTPHHGAPMERLGNWLDTLLVSRAITRPFANIGQIRSSGVTDLRYGNVVAADWQGIDRFENVADRRQMVPLPKGVACYAIAASLGEPPPSPIDQARGDGLVPVASALGQHPDPARCLAFGPQSQWVAYGMNHWDLLNRAEVGKKLLQWLGP